MKKNINYLLAAFIIAVTISAFVLPKSKSSSIGLEKDNEPSPSLNLVDKNGEAIQLKDFKGKVVVLNLWASWCPPCIAEMPSLEKFYNQMDTEEIALIMLSLDRDFDKSIAFMDKKAYKMPYYKPTSPLPAPFAVNAIPATFIINKKGELVGLHSGMTDFMSAGFLDEIKSASAQ
ncbi:TlpA family protein disulfide reductase [Echinicola marina]|uniref:TlpA family protein disulfide reductase n=1 Tax=Echinicola marina TaxID=2859768 RepID=UPI001CF64588|nr:TlpA disulfide reductase family protein [Echinicola marina]UCS91694.1 TlpA family protein disulfide reductase [Echinicola marina]